MRRFLFPCLLLTFLAQAATGQTAGWSALPPLPDSPGVASPFAGVSGGALLVAGGANFPDAPPWSGGKKVWHDAVYVLDAPAGSWKVAGKLPRPLGYGVSITHDDTVICIGGSDADRHYADVLRLRWNGQSLTTEPLPSLPRPIANACGAIIGNTIYVAGGIETPNDAAALHVFLALDLSQSSPAWKQLETWPGEGRMLAVAAAQEGSFFLFSGTSLSAGPDGKPVRRYLKDAYRYKPGAPGTPGKGWSRIADLPRAAVAAPSPAPAVGAAHVLIFSGDDGTRIGFQPPEKHPGFPRDVLAYHTITDVWAATGECEAPRVTVPVVAWSGRIVVPSGEMRPGVRSPEVWSYAPVDARASFGWLNYATLTLYMAGMMLLGSWFARRNKTTDDYFRGGQRIPWWAAGLSIFATMLSSITFMAIPAQSFSVGWNLFLANSYLLLTPLVALVYMPFYRRLNITSAYEYLEKRFNTASRLIASGLFMLFQIGRVTIVLYLPSLALATVSNLDIRLCITVMGALVIIYSVLGGVEGVIWTDVAQSFVLMGGALWALITIVLSVDGGPGEMIAVASEKGKFFSTVNWSFDYTIGAGWIILVGSIFTNLFPYTASQDVVQRYVTTADEKSASRAIWTNSLVAPVAQAVFFAIGTALFVFYRQHPSRLDPTLPVDSVFPQFIVRELPAGVAGVIVAAIFAAAQSTLSSSLNSVASAYVIDVHKRFNPQASDRSCLRLARWLTAGVGIVGTAAALVFTVFDVRSVWEVFLAIIGLFGGTISGLFALGIFTRRATGGGAIVGAVVSAALVFAVKAFTSAHFFCYPVVGVTACVLVGWVASLWMPAPPRDLRGLTIHTLHSSPPLQQ